MPDDTPWSGGPDQNALGSPADINAIYAYAQRWIEFGDAVYEYGMILEGTTLAARWSDQDGQGARSAALRASGLVALMLTNPAQGTQAPSACRMLWNVGEAINHIADKLVEAKQQEDANFILAMIFAAFQVVAMIIGKLISLSAALAEAVGNVFSALQQLLVKVAAAFTDVAWVQDFAGFTGAAIESAAFSVGLDVAFKEIVYSAKGLKPDFSSEDSAKELGLAAGTGAAFGGMGGLVPVGKGGAGAPQVHDGTPPFPFSFGGKGKVGTTPVATGGPGGVVKPPPPIGGGSLGGRGLPGGPGTGELGAGRLGTGNPGIGDRPPAGGPGATVRSNGWVPPFRSRTDTPGPTTTRPTEPTTAAPADPVAPPASAVPHGQPPSAVRTGPESTSAPAQGVSAKAATSDVEASGASTATAAAGTARPATGVRQPVAATRTDPAADSAPPPGRTGTPAAGLPKSGDPALPARTPDPAAPSPATKPAANRTSDAVPPAANRTPDGAASLPAAKPATKAPEGTTAPAASPPAAKETGGSAASAAPVRSDGVSAARDGAPTPTTRQTDQAVRKYLDAVVDHRGAIRTGSAAERAAARAAVDHAENRAVDTLSSWRRRITDDWAKHEQDAAMPAALRWLRENRQQVHADQANAEQALRAQEDRLSKPVNDAVDAMENAFHTLKQTAWRFADAHAAANPGKTSRPGATTLAKARADVADAEQRLNHAFDSDAAHGGVDDAAYRYATSDGDPALHADLESAQDRVHDAVNSYVDSLIRLRRLEHAGGDTAPSGGPAEARQWQRKLTDDMSTLDHSVAHGVEKLTELQRFLRDGPPAPVPRPQDGPPPRATHPALDRAVDRFGEAKAAYLDARSEHLDALRLKLTEAERQVADTEPALADALRRNDGPSIDEALAAQRRATDHREAIEAEYRALLGRPGGREVLRPLPEHPVEPPPLTSDRLGAAKDHLSEVAHDLVTAYATARRDPTVHGVNGADAEALAAARARHQEAVDHTDALIGDALDRWSALNRPPGTGKGTPLSDPAVARTRNALDTALADAREAFGTYAKAKRIAEAEPSAAADQALTAAQIRTLAPFQKLSRAYESHLDALSHYEQGRAPGYTPEGDRSAAIDSARTQPSDRAAVARSLLNEAGHYTTLEQLRNSLERHGTTVLPEPAPRPAPTAANPGGERPPLTSGGDPGPGGPGDGAGYRGGPAHDDGEPDGGPHGFPTESGHGNGFGNRVRTVAGDGVTALAGTGHPPLDRPAGPPVTRRVRIDVDGAPTTVTLTETDAGLAAHVGPPVRLVGSRPARPTDPVRDLTLPEDLTGPTRRPGDVAAPDHEVLQAFRDANERAQRAVVRQDPAAGLGGGGHADGMAGIVDRTAHGKALTAEQHALLRSHAADRIQRDVDDLAGAGSSGASSDTRPDDRSHAVENLVHRLNRITGRRARLLADRDARPEGDAGIDRRLHEQDAAERGVLDQLRDLGVRPDGADWGRHGRSDHHVSVDGELSSVTLARRHELLHGNRPADLDRLNHTEQQLLRRERQTVHTERTRDLAAQRDMILARERHLTDRLVTSVRGVRTRLATMSALDDPSVVDQLAGHLNRLHQLVTSSGAVGTRGHHAGLAATLRSELEDLFDDVANRMALGNRLTTDRLAALRERDDLLVRLAVAQAQTMPADEVRHLTRALEAARERFAPGGRDALARAVRTLYRRVGAVFGGSAAVLADRQRYEAAAPGLGLDPLPATAPADGRFAGPADRPPDWVAGLYRGDPSWPAGWHAPQHRDTLSFGQVREETTVGRAGDRIAVWLPGTPPERGIVGTRFAATLLPVFGTADGAMFASPGGRIRPPDVADLLADIRGGRTPMLLAARGATLAPDLATRLGAPVVASPYALVIDPATGAVTGIEGDGTLSEEDTFRLYRPGGPTAGEPYRPLLAPVEPAPVPADQPSSPRQLVLAEPRPVAESSARVAAADGPAPAEASEVRVRLAEGVLATGIPRRALPGVPELVRALRGLARARNVAVPAKDWAELPTSLLTNYRYLTTGYVLTLGGMEVEVSLSGTDARAASVTAGGGEVTVGDTTNSQFQTGGHNQGHSGQTGSTRISGGITATLPLDGGFGPVKIGASLTVTRNRTNRGTSFLTDAEKGKVLNSRGPATLVSLASEWRIRVRTGDRTWSRGNTLRPRDRLAVWIPDQYLKNPEARVSAGVGDAAKAALPDHFHAGGLTGLTELYDEILKTMAANGRPLPLGGVERRTLRDELWNLDTHLAVAVDGGFPIDLFDAYGKAVARVTVNARRQEGTAPVGATSDIAHVENVRTAISGAGGALDSSDEVDLGLPNVSVGLPGPWNANIGFGPTVTRVATNTTSGSRNGLWVVVPRYAKHVVAYRMGFAMGAEISMRGVRRTVTTGTVTGDAVVSLPEPDAYAAGLPVDRNALPERLRHDGAPHEPNVIRETTLPTGTHQPPRHLRTGHGIGQGFVRLAPAPLGRLRGNVMDALRGQGFVPADERHPFTDGGTGYAPQRMTTKLRNLDLVDRMLSPQGLESHYNTIHQDGMRFTVKRPTGWGTELSATVVVTATQRTDSLRYVRTTDEYHTVNLPMGMGFAGRASAGQAKTSLGITGAFGFHQLKAFVLGLGWFGSASVRQQATHIVNMPGLLEYPGRVDVFDSESTYTARIEYLNPGMLSSPPDETTLDEVTIPATLHTLPWGSGEPNGDAVGTGDSTDVGVLDQAVIYHVDAKGLSDKLLDLGGRLTGRRGESHGELSSFGGTVQTHANFKAIARGQYTTDVPFDAGLVTTTTAAATISATLGRSSFLDSTDDKYVLGQISLYLAQATSNATEQSGWSAEAKLSPGTMPGALPGPADASLGGTLDAALSGDTSRITGGMGLTGGIEHIQLNFGRAYLYTMDVDFRLGFATEKHGKLRFADYRAEPAKVKERTVLYVLSEPEALRRYAAGDLPVPQARLFDTLTRWTDGAGEVDALGADVVAGAVLRWAETHPYPELPAPVSGAVRKLARDHAEYVRLDGNVEPDTRPDPAQPIWAADLRRRFTERFTTSLEEPRQPALPAYLVRGSGAEELLGHIGVRNVSLQSGRTVYDVVKGAIDAVDPELLAKNPEIWKDGVPLWTLAGLRTRVPFAGTDQRMVGKLQSGVDALQGVLSTGREQALIEELYGPQGLRLQLVRQRGWLRHEVVEVVLTVRRTGAPAVTGFTPNSGTENYGHAYRSTSEGRSRSLGASLLGALSGGGQGFSPGGSWKFATGGNRGTTVTGQNTEEQTVYDWGGRYEVTLPHELTVQVRRHGGSWPFLSDRPAEPVRVPGTLDLQVPASLVDGIMSGPAALPDFQPLPRLPRDAYVLGVSMEQALPRLQALLRTAFREDPWRRPDVEGHPTLSVLTSKAVLTNHLPYVIGQRYLLEDNLFLPGAPTERARLFMTGEIVDLQVVQPVESGTGTGRYAKWQSGTTASGGRNRWAGTGQGTLNAGLPTTPAVGLSHDRSHARPQAATHGATENVRDEQHVKEQGPVYLVRVRGRFRYDAERFHRDEHSNTADAVFPDGRPPATLHRGESFSGEAFVEMYADEYERLVSQHAKQIADGTWDRGSWPSFVGQPRVSLPDLLGDAAAHGIDATGITRFAARSLGARYRTGEPLVLRYDDTDLALARYRAVLAWAVERLPEEQAVAARADLAGVAGVGARIRAMRGATRDLELSQIDKGIGALITAVNRSEREPFALPPEVALTTLDPVFLARDLAYELDAPLLLQRTGRDGRSRLTWISPRGSVYDHDPRRADRDALVRAARARYQTFDARLREAVTGYGLTDRHLASLYEIAGRSGRTFEQAVSAEIRRLGRRSHGAADTILGTGRAGPLNHALPLADALRAAGYRLDRELTRWDLTAGDPRRGAPDPAELRRVLIHGDVLLGGMADEAVARIGHAYRRPDADLGRLRGQAEAARRRIGAALAAWADRTAVRSPGVGTGALLRAWAGQGATLAGDRLAAMVERLWDEQPDPFTAAPAVESELRRLPVRDRIERRGTDGGSTGWTAGYDALWVANPDGGPPKVVLDTAVYLDTSRVADAASVTAFTRQAGRALDRYFNTGHRLPDGSPLSFRVRFVDSPADALHTIALHDGPVNDNIDDLGVDSQPHTIAHEFGHLFGLDEEYRAPGRAGTMPVYTDSSVMAGGMLQPDGTAAYDPGQHFGGIDPAARLHPRNLRQWYARINPGGLRTTVSVAPDARESAPLGRSRPRRDGAVRHGNGVTVVPGFPTPARGRDDSIPPPADTAVRYYPDSWTRDEVTYHVQQAYLSALRHGDTVEVRPGIVRWRGEYRGVVTEGTAATEVLSFAPAPEQGDTPAPFTDPPAPVTAPAPLAVPERAGATPARPGMLRPADEVRALYARVRWHLDRHGVTRESVRAVAATVELHPARRFLLAHGRGRRLYRRIGDPALYALLDDATRRLGDEPTTYDGPPLGTPVPVRAAFPPPDEISVTDMPRRWTHQRLLRSAGHVTVPGGGPAVLWFGRGGPPQDDEPDLWLALRLPYANQLSVPPDGILVLLRADDGVPMVGASQVTADILASVLQEHPSLAGRTGTVTLLARTSRAFADDLADRLNRTVETFVDDVYVAPRTGVVTSVRVTGSGPAGRTEVLPGLMYRSGREGDAPVARHIPMPPPAADQVWESRQVRRAGIPLNDGLPPVTLQDLWGDGRLLALNAPWSADRPFRAVNLGDGQVRRELEPRDVAASPDLVAGAELIVVPFGADQAGWVLDYARRLAAETGRVVHVPPHGSEPGFTPDAVLADLRPGGPRSWTTIVPDGATSRFHDDGGTLRQRRAVAAADRTAGDALARALLEAPPATGGTFSYLDSPDLFAEHGADALGRLRHGWHPVPLVPGIATTLPIGLEIEFVFPGLDGRAHEPERELRLAMIRDAMAAEGLLGAEPGPDDPPYSADPYAWRLVDDGSVHGEIVSPMLTGSMVAWHNLMRILAIIRAHGGANDHRAGGHVHIAVPGLAADTERLTRVVRWLGGHQDLLWRLTADPQPGTRRGTMFRTPLEPVPPPPDAGSLIAGLSRGPGDYPAVNLSGVTADRRGHLELRFPDGSLDAHVIQARVNLLTAMVEHALYHEPVVPTHQGAGDHDLLGLAPIPAVTELDGQGVPWTVWETEPADHTVGVRTLLDEILHRDEDKQQAAALYHVTTYPDHPAGPDLRFADPIPPHRWPQVTTPPSHDGGHGEEWWFGPEPAALPRLRARFAGHPFGDRPLVIGAQMSGLNLLYGDRGLPAGGLAHLIGSARDAGAVGRFDHVVMLASGFGRGGAVAPAQRLADLLDLPVIATPFAIALADAGALLIGPRPLYAPWPTTRDHPDAWPYGMFRFLPGGAGRAAPAPLGPLGARRLTELPDDGLAWEWAPFEDPVLREYAVEDHFFDADDDPMELGDPPAAGGAGFPEPPAAALVPVPPGGTAPKTVPDGAHLPDDHDVDTRYEVGFDFDEMSPDGGTVEFTGTAAYTVQVLAGPEPSPIRLDVAIHLDTTPLRDELAARHPSEPPEELARRVAELRSGTIGTATAAIDRLYNTGHRLPNGEPFSVRVRFVERESRAHHIVRLHAEFGRPNVTNWAVGLPPRVYAHEFGHLLGLPDEYRDARVEGRRVVYPESTVMSGGTVDANGHPTYEHGRDVEQGTEDPAVRIFPRHLRTWYRDIGGQAPHTPFATGVLDRALYGPDRRHDPDERPAAGTPLSSVAGPGHTPTRSRDDGETHTAAGAGAFGVLTAFDQGRRADRISVVHHGGFAIVTWRGDVLGPTYASAGVTPDATDEVALGAVRASLLGALDRPAPADGAGFWRGAVDGHQVDGTYSLRHPDRVELHYPPQWTTEEVRYHVEQAYLDAWRQGRYRPLSHEVWRFTGEYGGVRSQIDVRAGEVIGFRPDGDQSGLSTQWALPGTVPTFPELTPRALDVIRRGDRAGRTGMYHRDAYRSRAVSVTGAGVPPHPNGTFQARVRFLDPRERPHGLHARYEDFWHPPVDGPAHRMFPSSWSAVNLGTAIVQAVRAGRSVGSSTALADGSEHVVGWYLGVRIEAIAVRGRITAARPTPEQPAPDHGAVLAGVAPQRILPFDGRRLALRWTLYSDGTIGLRVAARFRFTAADGDEAALRAARADLRRAVRERYASAHRRLTVAIEFVTTGSGPATDVAVRADGTWQHDGMSGTADDVAALLGLPTGPALDTALEPLVRLLPPPEWHASRSSARSAALAAARDRDRPTDASWARPGAPRPNRLSDTERDALRFFYPIPDRWLRYLVDTGWTDDDVLMAVAEVIRTRPAVEERGLFRRTGTPIAPVIVYTDTDGAIVAVVPVVPGAEPPPGIPYPPHPDATAEPDIPAEPGDAVTIRELSESDFESDDDSHPDEAVPGRYRGFD